MLASIRALLHARQQKTLKVSAGRPRDTRGGDVRSRCPAPSSALAVLRQTSAPHACARDERGARGGACLRTDRCPAKPESNLPPRVRPGAADGMGKNKHFWGRFWHCLESGPVPLALIANHHRRCIHPTSNRGLPVGHETRETLAWRRVPELQGLGPLGAGQGRSYWSSR